MFRLWFFAIVRNRTIDILRSQKSYKATLQKNVMGHIAATVTPVEDEINNSMVFSRLPPAFRDVLILTKVAGFTTRETADKLGISESTVRVRVRVHRGIKETRKILEIDEYPESN